MACDLTVGDVFVNYDALFEKVNEYGRAKHCLFVKGECRKSKTGGGYEYVNFVCKQGGKMRPSRSKNVRPNQSTIKCGCPVTIRASAIRSAGLGSTGYKITKLELAHNHETSEMIYQSYPENRRAHLTTTVEELLSCPSVTNNHIRLHIEKTQNKTLFTSDVRNLKMKMSGSNGDDLKKVDDVIKEIQENGGSVEFAKDDEGCFKYLVFITGEMKNLLRRFPDILVMDTTYKTNAYLLPLTTVMCIDSCGMGHPILHAFLRREDSESITACLQFLSLQYVSEETCTFFVDKDMAEISSIEETFPSTAISLCGFHVKQAIKRALNGKGMKQHLVTTLCDLFFQQAEATSLDKFEELQKSITDLCPDQVVEYFKKNSWSCSHLWAAVKNLQTPHLHLTTTNHLESYHAKIKKTLHCKMLLNEVLQYLLSHDALQLKQANVRSTLLQVKRRYNTKDNDPILQEITDNLTPIAAKFVGHQYSVAKSIGYSITATDGSMYIVKHSDDNTHTTSENQCDCKSFINMKLPCRHVFALRQSLGLPAYEPVSDSHRFSKFSLCTQSTPTLHTGEVSVVCVSEEQEKKVLTPEEKYTKAERLLKEFSTYLALVGTQDFHTKYEQLSTILSMWRNNKDVVILETDSGRELATTSTGSLQPSSISPEQQDAISLEPPTTTALSLQPSSPEQQDAISLEPPTTTPHSLQPSSISPEQQDAISLEPPTTTPYSPAVSALNSKMPFPLSPLQPLPTLYSPAVSALNSKMPFLLSPLQPLSLERLMSIMSYIII